MIQTSDLHISCLALYDLSYLGSFDGTVRNLSRKCNAMQDSVALRHFHNFTDELATYYLYISNFLNQIEK